MLVNAQQTIRSEQCEGTKYESMRCFRSSQMPGTPPSLRLAEQEIS
jgi:hypothetical protein